jgi:hypothetical protein
MQEFVQYRPATPIDEMEDEDANIKLVPVKTAGGERIRRLKVFIKIVFTVVAFMLM